ncbi:RimK family alpha-L-glutamate ligase [Corallococcus exiguus]|uniref:ATP-grasp domain-containing protein n=1 Tax=Corallococcus TaxID=83461 RepID=UPI000EA21C92|nr:MULTISPECIES: RimK family alpha-L-glutamate ligase [Corallococcus]NRD52886.1 RimK family alpha-L-glutamate ligase [Corallococcus exiguus]NRD68124.1 RimK family alpha-L-glutamate ligase [Corallococcus exiguus]RKH28934.1 RimK family alpha-L-glutamate ligase [Corallococcus sp. CA041A]RKI10518.1 RimK family alpha-L-glutamate ligase [Corallococcus sp. AB030]RUO94048.1 RimK family alpha-L-glutamate ligase [Corallococcus sp. AB018]
MPPRKAQPKKAPVPPGAQAPERGDAPRPKRPRVKKTVAILSRKRSLYSTRRLVEAIKARGHRALVFDTLRCCLLLARGQPRMTYRGAEVKGVDVVIPRIGASITAYGLAVVNHFEMMDVPVLNPPTAIARSRDKLRALQFLARAGLDMPRTVMAHDRGNVRKLVQEVGGLPVIIKLIRGTQGVGVMIAHTLPEVQTILDTFWDLGQEIVLQEFVAESEGRDVRALVVGDTVVGAMRRKAKKGEFRSNIHRGGEGRAITLSSDYMEAAVKAARIIGLEVAGVDMLEGREGPRLMEINSSPGFEGLEGATGQDIAGHIVEHALVYAGTRGSALRARAGRAS